MPTLFEELMGIDNLQYLQQLPFHLEDASRIGSFVHYYFPQGFIYSRTVFAGLAFLFIIIVAMKILIYVLNKTDQQLRKADSKMEKSEKKYPDFMKKSVRFLEVVFTFATNLLEKFVSATISPIKNLIIYSAISTALLSPYAESLGSPSPDRDAQLTLLETRMNILETNVEHNRKSTEIRLEEKIKNTETRLEGKIDDAETRLEEKIDADLKETSILLSNEIDAIASSLKNELKETQSMLDTKIEKIESNLREEINTTAANLGEKMEEAESDLREEMNRTAADLEVKINTTETTLNGKINLTAANITNSFDEKIERVAKIPMEIIQMMPGEKIKLTESRLVEKMKAIETRIEGKIDNIGTRLDGRIKSVETRFDIKMRKLGHRKPRERGNAEETTGSTGDIKQGGDIIITTFPGIAYAQSGCDAGPQSPGPECDPSPPEEKCPPLSPGSPPCGLDCDDNCVRDLVGKLTLEEGSESSLTTTCKSECNTKEQINEAIGKYETGLAMCNKEKTPLKCATIENNLGTLYAVMSNNDDILFLDRAIHNFENARDAYDKHRSKARNTIQRNLNLAQNVLKIRKAPESPSTPRQ